MQQGRVTGLGDEERLWAASAVRPESWAVVGGPGSVATNESWVDVPSSRPSSSFCSV